MSEFLLGQARRMRDAGNFPEAARLYGDILRMDPQQFEALHSLGSLYYQAMRYSDAERYLSAAVAVDSRSSDTWFLLGCLVQRQKRFDDAIICYDTTLALKPQFTDALVNRGVVLMALHRDADALVSIDAALAIDSSVPIAWVNRGLALRQLGRYEEALTSFDKAVELKPGMVEAYINRGSTRFVMKRYPEAVSDYEQAVAIMPEMPYLKGNLVHYRLHCCDWRHLEQDTAAISKGVRAGKRIVQPYVHLTISQSAAEQLQCARIAIASDAPSTAPLWRGERYDHDKIRIAYISADFRDHAVARLIAGVFEAHDRTRFETTALALTPDDGSEMRARLSRAFDDFIDVEARSDSDAALLLKERETDIAVDLTGFTTGGRPGILACRPAPLQVSFLGYPGTMGASYVDYIVADPIVIPNEHVSHYIEKIVALPDTYQCNDSKRRIANHAPTRSEAGLPEQSFVFCCFNNSSKIRPATFDTWMRILKQSERSVLWLLETSPAAAHNLKREAEARGVASDRLIFAARANPPEHLARHALADLFLDTLPYGAHTTASDALWAGLPVLTCLGTTFAGRVGASLLHAIGLPELVTHSFPDYEALALKLACDPAPLATLKTKLAQNRDSHPLFDTVRFTRHLEQAFTTICERQRQGLSPQSFAVPRSAVRAP